jgi:hypothetical protein
LPTSATNDRYAEFAEARASLFSRDAAALIVISVCWTAAILLVNPIGEFPAVDDWAYLKSVQALVERGEIVFSDWSAPNLITHILWGALFAVPFSVSYTTLRISTLVAALLCAFALYKLLREAGAPVAVAVFAALAISRHLRYWLAAGDCRPILPAIRTGHTFGLGRRLPCPEWPPPQNDHPRPVAAPCLLGSATRLRILARGRWAASPPVRKAAGIGCAAAHQPREYRVHGLYFGLNRGEIRAKLDEITTLTELGPFLDMPVSIRRACARASISPFRPPSRRTF